MLLRLIYFKGKISIDKSKRGNNTAAEREWNAKGEGATTWGKEGWWKCKCRPREKKQPKSLLGNIIKFVLGGFQYHAVLH